MWQRIQTLYLLLVALLMSLFAFSEVFILTHGGKAFILKAWSIVSTDPTSLVDAPEGPSVWVLGVLAVISAVVAVVTIFYYKRRVVQARIAVGNALVQVGLVGYMAYLGYVYPIEGFKFAMVYPLISVILQVLAARAIWADELLVRISNRLR